MLSYFRFYFRFQHLGVLPSFTCHLHIFDFSPAPNSISIHPADGMIAESPPQLDQSVQKNPAGSPRIRTNPNERLKRWVFISKAPPCHLATNDATTLRIPGRANQDSPLLVTTILAIWQPWILRSYCDPSVERSP